MYHYQKMINNIIIRLFWRCCDYKGWILLSLKNKEFAEAMELLKTNDFLVYRVYNFSISHIQFKALAISVSILIGCYCVSTYCI